MAFATAQSEEDPFKEELLNDEEVVAPETTPPPELAPTGQKDLSDEDYDKIAKAKEAAAEAVEVGRRLVFALDFLLSSHSCGSQA